MLTPKLSLIQTPSISTNLQLYPTLHHGKCLHRLGIPWEALPRAEIPDDKTNEIGNGKEGLADEYLEGGDPPPMTLLAYREMPEILGDDKYFDSLRWENMHRTRDQMFVTDWSNVKRLTGLGGWVIRWNH